MRRRLGRNFQNRFGDRFSVVYLNKPLPPAEQKSQNESLCKAITEVMAGILKRELTQEELLGLEDISTHKRRDKTEEKQSITEITEPSVILPGGKKA